MEKFQEVAALLAHIPADSETAEVNTGWLEVGLYFEIVVLISVGDIAAGATFDVDIEDADDSAGNDVDTILSMTQLTATDDDKAILITIDPQADLTDDNKRYIRVECTPAVGAVEFSVMVLGYRPRYAPVATTNWAQIVT